MVLFENLRAIHEPFNKTRGVIGFDTFTGYRGFSEQDTGGDIIYEGGYSVTDGYQHYLEQLLMVHEGNNVLGHVRGCHEVVVGDVTETAPKFFADRPELTVALAYFDLGLYGPTSAALRAIKPHLVPGSVILLDEFCWSEAKGEAIAFKEIFKPGEYRIEKSDFTPMRAIVTVS